MTGTDDGLMEALSHVDPARADLPPAKGSVRYNSILEAAMKTDATRDRRRAAHRDQPMIRRWSGRRLTLSTAAAVVVLAGAITAVMLFTHGPTGITSMTPALAAEAVNKAAADTAAAGQSGIIDTTLVENGVPVLTRTFSWNGEDLSVRAGGEQQGVSELRYVDGHFYEKGYFAPAAVEDQQWHHYTDYDNGGGDHPGPNAANTDFVPAGFLTDSRSALVGSGLMDLVGSASELTQTSSAEGNHTYTGALTVAKLLAHDLGLSGVPFAGQPLGKMGLRDQEAPVSIKVTVDSSGLIKVATLDYQFEGMSWTYKVTYSELGSALAIAAPDPAHTTTLAGPNG